MNKAMQRQQDGLVPIGEVIDDLDGPVKALREASPQARHHFTQADQVNQLVSASEADPDLGFMARLMALCSLPRSNPRDRLRYVRRNGPYTLYMNAVGGCKLPFGNIPRLLMAWLSTEAVRTQSRELVLGRSLSEFMRSRNQQQQRWCSGRANPPPQPDEPAVRLHRFTDLRGRFRLYAGHFAGGGQARVLVERAQAR